MLTSPQTSSPVSSVHVREVEVMPPGSSEVISRLPDALPTIASPPEASPEEHPGTVELSGGLPVMTRWLRTVMRRSEKSQGSHQPDRLSRKPIRPAKPRSRPNSPARGNSANKGPSRMAAAQRRLVSVLIFGRQTARGVSDEPCQRTVAKTIQDEPQKQKPKEQVC